MKTENSDKSVMQESEIGITRNVTLHRYTEENSPFIKRKMDQARAILSKYPLPEFKDTSKEQDAKK
jgi:hypothetical protein